MTLFQALLASVDEEGKVELTIEEINRKDLPEGDVLIKVHYSGVNFKDGLAGTNARSGVVKAYPLVLGIDLSGEVVESKADQYKPGDQVIVHCYGLGVDQHGGYSEYASVPAEWVVPLPQGLTLKEAMILGTAGFTAAQSVQTLEDHGAQPVGKPVLVRGATGGVGSMAIQMLNQLGYSVTAETRKKDALRDYLNGLGAEEVVSPEEAQLPKKRPLANRKWQAVVDPVGGEHMADYLAQVDSDGSVALSGNAGGLKFDATVLPFILRGVNLLGINAVDLNLEKRTAIWKRLGSDLKPAQLEAAIDHQVSLEELPEALRQIMAGKMKGRILVKIKK